MKFRFGGGSTTKHFAIIIVAVVVVPHRLAKKGESTR